jgi:hypothetical protein
MSSSPTHYFVDDLIYIIHGGASKLSVEDKWEYTMF